MSFVERRGSVSSRGDDSKLKNVIEEDEEI